MELDPDLKRLVKAYFTYSLREYKASLLFISLFVFLYFLPDIEAVLFPPTYNEAVLTAKVRMLDSLAQASPVPETNYGSASPIENTTATQLFAFDPNTVGEDELAKLGFSPRQIRTLCNYRNKGGHFYKKEDVKKMYGISDSQYAVLEPYLSLPEKREAEKNGSGEVRYEARPGKSYERVELNSADTLELERLPHIGFGLARRIVKYRDALGGFVSVAQLGEVYGIRASLIDSLQPYLTLDAAQVRKMNINEEGTDGLKKHPYLKYRLASALVNYRMQHGPYRSAADLKNVVLMDDATLQKLMPYLTF